MFIVLTSNVSSVGRFSPVVVIGGQSYLLLEILPISPEHGDDEGQYGNQDHSLRDTLSENAVGSSAKPKGLHAH